MIGLCSQYLEYGTIAEAVSAAPGELAPARAAVEYGNSYYWWYYYVPTSRCHVPKMSR